MSETIPLFRMPATATPIKHPSRPAPAQSPAPATVQIECADATDRYEAWPAPTAIIVDGPYGVGGFPGDPHKPDSLGEWYLPHAQAWAAHSLPSTTLWFWGTEISWAITHPALERAGWEYRSAHIWDKGIGHIAGNVNGNTIRRFPVVTEVCVQYVRRVELRTGLGETLPMMRWLREEWLRTGLPLYRTNEACGVKNAATRKYFTQDHLWYFPPPEMMERLASYAAKHGLPTSHPYFSLDGQTPVTAEQWAGMRAKWNHSHAVTNVWSEPAVRGVERLKDEDAKCIHTNQKPLRLIELSIRASTDPGDVVWEPFGGLCSAAVASLRSGRACFSSEIDPDVFAAATERLDRERELLSDDAAAGA